MPDPRPLLPRPEVTDFLMSRRSRPARTLARPGPSREELEPILTAALRVPDHGKLEPWRLVVLEGAALERLAGLVARLGAERGMDTEKLAKSQAMFRDAPLIVAVVASPVESEKIPEVEQTLSAGAVCLNLLNAAAAAGWGAVWLSGWAARDRTFLDDGLGLQAPQWVAGFVVIGRETAVPPERPRPDLRAVATWVDA